MSRSNAALARELTSIRTSFRELAKSFGRMAPFFAIPRIVVNADGSLRRKPRLTRRHRAALKLQGKYMGTMRGLKPAQRAKVKKLRAAKGIAAAIRLAERMVG